MQNHFSILKRALHFLLLTLIISEAIGQNQLQPSDFLSKDFHAERRQKLREKMTPGSVAVFFANPVRNRANDVDYNYHQDPDFYYLTGYREPNAVLLIFKEKQKAPSGPDYDEIIFVQARNERAETWTGRRLGPAGVTAQLGFKMAFNGAEFSRYPIDFSKFSQVFFHEFQNDVRNEADSADLYDLILQFRRKANYPEVNDLVISQEKPANNLNISQLETYMEELRGIKTKEELDLLSMAVKISCAGQVEVMKALKPGMSEREIQGIHEFVFKKYQAEDLGYPSIVGAGHNGCILHYTENYRPQVDGKDLILMDLGAEYRGYTADITRTIPINGKFNPEQKIIYELVLNAQEQAMTICKPGTPFRDLLVATQKVIAKGLMENGIIKEEKEVRKYYPHGCCHHIGLDVHDRGVYDKLEENMVITIEPGIYIPLDSNVDPKWRGIAVRIEDDYLITKSGYEHLSKSAPRTVKEIEDIMTLPSALDDFILPTLKKD
ncbi:MAG: aminopeptidase P N-terminal domain-containing protein [Bacteroidetes bacterium]|nr:aminopeptidase P N-terminal domain-containing protein [Bacteroidota bacterium]